MWLNVECCQANGTGIGPSTGSHPSLTRPSPTFKLKPQSSVAGALVSIRVPKSSTARLALETPFAPSFFAFDAARFELVATCLPVADTFRQPLSSGANGSHVSFRNSGSI